jgi:hypothetical protein
MDATTILPVYHKCDVCNYTSILKANYDRHCMTKKHLKNIENHIEKVDSSLECLSTPTSQEEADSTSGVLDPRTSQKLLDEDSSGDEKPPQFDVERSVLANENDIFYAKIYNTIFELKRQYPNKYEFVRNTERMKREWVRWTQEQYENDFVFCYTKWFKGWLQVNNELIGKFVF